MFILSYITPWSWSCGSWIYKYICNQCRSPVKVWVRIPLAHGEVYSIQYYVIKFVGDLLQVGGFLWVPVSSTNKSVHHDIDEILLKVALNTIALLPQ